MEWVSHTVGPTPCERVVVKVMYFYHFSYIYIYIYSSLYYYSHFPRHKTKANMNTNKLNVCGAHPMWEGRCKSDVFLSFFVYIYIHQYITIPISQDTRQKQIWTQTNLILTIVFHMWHPYLLFALKQTSLSSDNIHIYKRNMILHHLNI